MAKKQLAKKDEWKLHCCDECVYAVEEDRFTVGIDGRRICVACRLERDEALAHGDKYWGHVRKTDNCEHFKKKI